ncbi:MAG: hypothetical protein ACYTHK_06000 [Planctomycetota bacterium]
MIRASREFVCVRLATYEDKAEGEFLMSIFRGRSGELENTVFCLLAPDGKTRLSRAGRSPDMAFDRSDERFVTALESAARKYRAKPGARRLPVMKDLRLALNVAACDNLPLAVAVGDKAEKQLAELAWDKRFAGKLIYVSVPRFDGAEAKSKLVVLQPDSFGRKPKVIAQGPKVDGKVLEKGIAAHRGSSRQTREHVRDGRRQGIYWETAIPVTDPGRPPR